MEGYIINNSSHPVYVFKRKLPAGHKILLSDVWNLYKDRVLTEAGKVAISESEFVKWLEDKQLMKEGFEYHPGYKEQGSSGEIMMSTPAVNQGEMEGLLPADGRMLRPSLAKAPQSIIDKLTWRDVANLRIIDDPERIICSINNVSKLRRAYTATRQMPQRNRVQKILRDRLSELERLK